MRRMGIDVRVELPVTGFADRIVQTADSPILADVVVLGLGVEPNSTLAEEAGIELGARNGIRVDRRQRTSAAGVWAAGDCVETWHRLLQTPTYLPLETTAHKQGRIAGENAVGGHREFAGTLGTQVVNPGVDRLRLAFHP